MFYSKDLNKEYSGRVFQNLDLIVLCDKTKILKKKIRMHGFDRVIFYFSGFGHFLQKTSQVNVHSHYRLKCIKENQFDWFNYF